MRIALDAKVLLYAEGINGRQRAPQARALVARLSAEDTVIAVQTLGEVYNVLVRKAHLPREQARDAVRHWQARFPVVDTTAEVMSEAISLAAAHEINIWDAVQVAVAASAGCTILLSEDLQDGFIWRGVEIVNPFSQERQAWLDALLD